MFHIAHTADHRIADEMKSSNDILESTSNTPISTLIPPETRFPLPALDLIIKHLIIAAKPPLAAVFLPVQGPSPPRKHWTEYRLGEIPPPENYVEAPTPLPHSCFNSLCSCNQPLYASSDMTSLSLVCQYFRAVIWRNRLRTLKISAAESFKRLEECVTKENRDAIR